MPKYYEFKVAGYYLYFTSHCVVEAMHVHAGDTKHSEGMAAKFFVRNNGDTVLQKQGINEISAFIKENYIDMYKKWKKKSTEGFYGEE